MCGVGPVLQFGEQVWPQRSRYLKQHRSGRDCYLHWLHFIRNQPPDKIKFPPDELASLHNLQEEYQASGALSCMSVRFL
jgi:hypothetical protein